MEPDSDHISDTSHTHARDLIATRETTGLRDLLRTFSPAERLSLYGLTLVLFLSGLVILAGVNAAVTTEVPTQGGSFVEGAIGTPRFINPLLAVSQPDADLSALIYSGLVRSTFEGGYVPDLAESYDISEDGTVYTFHLRGGLAFHNGEPLTSADVLFTVAMAQNPEVKSPRRADWEGVHAEAPDDRTVVFTLPHAYAPFLENARMGILPKALWETVPAEEFPFSSLNTHPTGSGPYRIANITFDATGAPQEYALRAFSQFALGAPYIRSFTYRLYANASELIAAYEDGKIDSFVADAPKNLSRDLRESEDMHTVPLARIFGVFYNQNHAPLLAKAEVRAALDAAVETQSIIDIALGGYGASIAGPVPPGLLETNAATSATHGPDAAREILSRNGWTFSTASSSEGVWKKGTDTLTMTLATADSEELSATANAVADAWKAAGIPTTVQVYPLTEFNQSVLRPRSFDAILFGEVVGRSLDLFAFWHSSQRNDPGLNLALYTSASADKSLASARAATNPEEREGYLREFIATLAGDRPAIFLYSPEIGYVFPSHLQGVELGTLTTAADRFASVYTWYRDTERVWNIFNK